MINEFTCNICYLTYPASGQDGFREQVCTDCVTEVIPVTTVSPPAFRKPNSHLTTAGMAKWLETHVTTIMLSDFAADLIDEVRDAIALTKRAIDRPADKVVVGECDQCGTIVYGIDGQRRAFCRTCGAVFDAEARQVWMLDTIRNQRGTATEISNQLRELAGIEIKAATIRQWARRMKLDDNGLGRYLIGDVLDLHSEADRQRER